MYMWKVNRFYYDFCFYLWYNVAIIKHKSYMTILNSHIK